RPLDPAGHEVAVRRLAVGGPELPREVGRGHQGALGHGRNIERPRVLPVDQIPRPAQVREVGQLLRVHGSTLSPTLRQTRLSCGNDFRSDGPQGPGRANQRRPAGRLVVADVYIGHGYYVADT